MRQPRPPGAATGPSDTAAVRLRGAAARLPEPLRSLLETWLTGRDPVPPAVPRRLPRLRRAVPLVATVAAALLAWATVASRVQVTGPWAVVVAVAGTAPLAVAVRRPLLGWRLGWLAALAVGLSDLPAVSGWWPWQPAQVIVLLVVLLLVGLRHRPGVLVWVAGFTAVLPMSFVPAENRIGTTFLFLAPLLIGGLVGARYAAQSRLAAEEERGAVLTERARIARELHDIVAHHMSLVAVRAETAPYRLGEVTEPARQEFAEISAASREALTEMRRLLGVLRDGAEPAPTTPQPGIAELPDLVAAAREAGGDVSVEQDGDVAGLPPAVDLSAYRIVQEALSNAVRHARGAPVSVAVRRTTTDVVVTVTNGPGISPVVDSAGGGHGLRGMAERVAMLDGDLDSGATPDGGFRVRARLPVHQPDPGRPAARREAGSGSGRGSREQGEQGPGEHGTGGHGGAE